MKLGEGGQKSEEAELKSLLLAVEQGGLTVVKLVEAVERDHYWFAAA